MKRKSLSPAIRLIRFLQRSVRFPLERRNFQGTTQQASAGRHRKAIMECRAKGIVRSRTSRARWFAAVMQSRWSCSMVLLTFGMALMGAAPLAAQSGCQAVDDAMNKVMTVPTHIYNAMSPIPSNGRTLRPSDTIHNETIYVGGSAYVKVSGKWSRSEWTLQRVMKQEQENRQQSKFTCRYLRDDSVNGEAAAVYSTHSERAQPEAKSDGQIWISKSKGLPLRHEMDVDAGSGIKDHHSVRYEYTNVQPPL
jgi:hypothetical protein